MIQLEPVYPELVEKIKESYRTKIDAEPNETMKKIIQLECDKAVAAEIGRQRQEAILQGGPLAERIKAENEAAKKEADAFMASFDPKVLEEARRMQAEAEAIMNGDKVCPYCDSTVTGGKFCPNCGAKLN